MSTFVGRMGDSGEIAVPVGSKLAVYSPSEVRVYVAAGGANHTRTWVLVTTTSPGVQYVSSAVTSATTCKLVTSEADAWYDVGASASITDRALIVSTQGAPTAGTGSATLTIAELLGGIITDTHATGASADYALPTGALTEAGTSMAVDECFDWYTINLSAAAADVMTLTAAAGHTIVGVAVTQSAHATTGGDGTGNCAHWRTRKTAADTFVTYRIG